jgi:signal transduction histidine kinase
VAVVEDISERKRVEQRIQDYQYRLKALASELTLAEEKERRRIAGDLHDHVSQSLALARLRLAAAAKAGSEAKRLSIMEEISECLRQAVGETRNVVFDLSSPSMNEIGLVAATSEWLEEEVQKRHGLKTEFVDECGTVPLDEDVRAILFRSVRELLTNVIKHARASRVLVQLKRKEDSLTIVVEDDGVGFDPEAVLPMAGQKGSFGLFSVQERMTDLGGSLDIESEPGRGCRIVLTAPLETSS